MSDILSWIRMDGPFLIGHRGYAARVRENTLPAFEEALEAGCDGVELDVHLSADGVPVVHHDADARSERGVRTLDRLRWSEIEGAWFEADGGRYRILSLGQVLAGLAGRCLINVEIKPAPERRRREVVESVHRLTDKVVPRESILISSFDAGILETLHGHDSSVLLAYLFAKLRDFNQLEQEPIVDSLTALHPRHDLVDAKLMKRASERSLMVQAWTVDDAEETERLLRLGVAGIITNCP